MSASQAELARMFPRARMTDARARVFCFPYAGGTSAIFDPLRVELPRDVELFAFEPPGRQSRQGEPLIRSMDQLLAPLVRHGASLFDRPYLLLGHSLGSWVSLELARTLRRIGSAMP